MDPNSFWTLPGIEQQEFQFLQNLLAGMNDYQQQQFYSIYQSRRKDPQTILLVTLLGFIVVAGVQRFMVNQIGMGILYLFTGGLCLVGTIVDLVTYRKLCWEYNRKMAVDSASIAQTFQ
ncbi:MAG TPA: TM2 domain-containing protein [Chitinophagaceae bacterium]|nr:TM2 domain-containing protein [Chitinophagaceae bacterium]